MNSHSLKTISRRKLLKMSSAALLAAGVWPGALRAEGDGPAANFTFVEINDLHYTTPECAEWHNRVLAQIKAAGAANQPEFLLLVGDLTEHGKPEHLAAVREIFDAAKFPYYVQIGNHDYVTQDDRKAYEENFPNRLNYDFNQHGWQFVAIDSTEGQHYEKTSISETTLAWLDAKLPKLDKKASLVLFTHFPLGPDVKYRPQNADAVLDRFKEFNLQAVFNGHFHGKTEKVVRGTVITTNPCCARTRENHDGTKAKGYFICRAKDGKITREFVEFK